METLPALGLDPTAPIALGNSLRIIFRIGVRRISSIDRPQGIVHKFSPNLSIAKRRPLHVFGHSIFSFGIDWMPIAHVALSKTDHNKISMKLEQQVCSLELARRLKELGVKQESYFIWTPWLKEEFPKNHPPKTVELDEWHVLSRDTYEVKTHCAAFTVAELGEIINSYENIAWRAERYVYSAYGHDDEDPGFQIALRKQTKNVWMVDGKEDNEANSRAKALIYLIENKFITLP